MLSSVRRLVAEVLYYIHQYPLSVTEAYDIVLDVHESVITPGRILCGYYFVSHQHRSVFWLDPVTSVKS
jgi:hypothetical protein